MPDNPDAAAHSAMAVQLLPVARRCALRLGLSPEAAEDCAMAFVGRMLLDDTVTGQLAEAERTSSVMPSHMPATFADIWDGARNGSMQMKHSARARGACR
jgi:hypothetical protein